MNKLTDLTKLIARSETIPTPLHDQDAASFGEETPDVSATLRRDLRRPIVLGTAVVLILVVGLLVWAAVSQISGAVIAPGRVRVEANSKQIRRLEGGVIRQILVREGQRVRRGQVLIRFDSVEPQASVDVYQAAVDSSRAQAARYQAEASNAADIRFPPELTRRGSDPQVGMMMASQRNLFASRMMLYRSQADVLRSQAGQLQTQILGLRAQLGSLGTQSELIGSELDGVRELNQQGYAPRSRMLALQRNAAGLRGQQGSVLSDISRAQQSIGDVRIQLAQLDDKRQTEAAEGLRTAQTQLTEVEPKLGSLRNTLTQSALRAPVDGYVFNLTQFTEGGTAVPGELLMDIVPAGGELVIMTQVQPKDITNVKLGMRARVSLTAYNPRTTPEIEGRVTLISADAVNDEKSGISAYMVQVKVSPAELAKAGPDTRLSPGMPAQVAIVTGSRTILDYLLAPLTEGMRTALRER